jgi:hypothetical protein
MKIFRQKFGNKENVFGYVPGELKFLNSVGVEY